MTTARDEQLKEEAPPVKEAPAKITLRCRFCGAIFLGWLTTRCPQCKR